MERKPVINVGVYQDCTVLRPLFQAFILEAITEKRVQTPGEYIMWSHQCGTEKTWCEQ